MKRCDCGTPHAEHPRCKECWVLIHYDKKFCTLPNSPLLIGYTTNGIRCWECVPNSNAGIEPPPIPVDAELKEIRRKKMLVYQKHYRERKRAALAEKRALKMKEGKEQRKAKQREYKKKKYLQDPEKQRKKVRERYRKLNEQFLTKKENTVG